MRLLTPLGLYRLIHSIFKYGINIMALLCFAKRTHGHKTALVDRYENLTYNELMSQSEKLSTVLKGKYNLNGGKKAGLMCKNHASLVKSIFAVSLSGADVYLLKIGTAHV
jgi:acyl-CoA synthetase (AMP-forming)/AMP-acid ligase II